MANEKVKLEAFLVAVEGSAGIKATIAKRLGLHRHTVELYLKRHPRAIQAYKEEVETVGDVVEGVILSAINNKDIETAKWYAKMKLKHRGYIERQERLIDFGSRDPMEVRVIDYYATLAPVANQSVVDSIASGNEK